MAYHSRPLGDVFELVSHDTLKAAMEYVKGNEENELNIQTAQDVREDEADQKIQQDENINHNEINKDKTE